MPIRPENVDRYPADWHQISFRIRFARALGRCECAGECRTGHTDRCEARHNGEHPRTGSKVVLTVAHLDHTPENSTDDNLRAFCQLCHLAYDTDEHKATAARTRAAETAAWNTPLPGLDAPATPTPVPAQTPSSTGAIPHRGHFPAKQDAAVTDFALIRVPETPQEDRDLAGAYVASRARALGWTPAEHEYVLLALFEPLHAATAWERQTLAADLRQEQP